MFYAVTTANAGGQILWQTKKEYWPAKNANSAKYLARISHQDHGSRLTNKMTSLNRDRRGSTTRCNFDYQGIAPKYQCPISNLCRLVRNAG